MVRDIGPRKPGFLDDAALADEAAYGGEPE